MKLPENTVFTSLLDNKTRKKGGKWLSDKVFPPFSVKKARNKEGKQLNLPDLTSFPQKSPVPRPEVSLPFPHQRAAGRPLLPDRGKGKMCFPSACTKCARTVPVVAQGDTTRPILCFVCRFHPSILHHSCCHNLYTVPPAVCPCCIFCSFSVHNKNSQTETSVSFPSHTQSPRWPYRPICRTDTFRSSISYQASGSRASHKRKVPVLLPSRAYPFPPQGQLPKKVFSGC